MELSDIKDKDDVISFVFSEVYKAGIMDSKLKKIDLKLKVLKLILPSSLQRTHIGIETVERIQYMVKKGAGILIEFTNDDDDVLYQLNTTEFPFHLLTKNNNL